MLRLTALALSILLTGCSSSAILVRPTSLWPFQQLEISDHTGALTAYYSRPDVAPAHLVVILQDAPCYQGDSASQRVSTSGILWKELHADSAFVQFEPVGVSRSDSPALACTLSGSAQMTRASWARHVERAVAAIKRHEHLLRVPTIYFGIGDGAVVATALASQDRDTAALIVLNGENLATYFDSLLHSIRDVDAVPNGRINVLAPAGQSLRADAAGFSGRARSADILGPAKHVPVLIVHAAADGQAPLESALMLFAELLLQEHGAAAMLVLRDLGHDLGLSGSRPECFDAALRQIVARLRVMTRSAGELAGQLELSDCNSALQEFPEPSEN